MKGGIHDRGCCEGVFCEGGAMKGGAMKEPLSGQKACGTHHTGKFSRFTNFF